MSESTDKEAVVAALDKDVSRLSAIETELQRLAAEHQAELASLATEYARRMDPLVTERKGLMDGVAASFVQHQALLLVGRIKTVVLRAGRLSARMSTSVEVTDEEAAIAYLRRRGWLHRFATREKWKTSKSKLGKDPALAAKIPGVEVRTIERLTLKFNRPLKEQFRDLFPFRRQIS